MSSIVSAMDKHIHNKQFGENGHAEYAWSEESAELVVQFFFQLVRCKSDGGKKDLENNEAIQNKKTQRTHVLACYDGREQPRTILNHLGPSNNSEKNS